MSSYNGHVHITRRNFLRGLGLLSASAALAACAEASQDGGQEVQEASPLLAIIHTNDTHGHDVEVAATENAAGNFSMAAVASLKKDYEDKGYEVLVVDAGDATQGMPLVDSDHGESAIAFMNSCGYELMAVGNHEFDWGLDNLVARKEQANFPLLSANTLIKETDEPLFTQNKVCELLDGTKVGFFGLTTPSTVTTTNPKNVETLKFLEGGDLYDCAQKQVDELRNQGCEFVVCVGHLGNEEEVGGNSSKSVLEHVKGIDLFIDGHDHLEVEEEVSGTPLVETGCYLHNIGVILIDNGVPSHKLVAYGTYEGIDAATQAIIDKEEDRIDKELGVVLGETAFFLNGEREIIRKQETNLGDFVADALAWTSEQELGHAVDGALVNSGALRCSIEAGDISLRDIKSVMPFANDLAVVNVTGAQLLEALEAACRGVGTSDAPGSFPQVSGITFKVDGSVPYEEGPTYPNSTAVSPAKPGARVTIQDVGGRGFDEKETYTIATSSFLCNGGDTYYAFKAAADAETPVTFGFDYEALVSYLVTKCDHKVPDEYAEPQGRITFVGLG